MQIVVQKYPVIVTTNLGEDRRVLDVRGTFIRCTAAQEDFSIRIDDGPEIPFGLARSIGARTPEGSPIVFSKVEVVKVGAGINANTVELVIGEIDFIDTRTAFFPAQEIRVARARTMETSDVTIGAGVPIPGTGSSTYQIGALAETLMFNIRNKSATNSMRISQSYADLAAGLGYELGAGENVDIPVGTTGQTATGYLYLKGTAPDVAVVTRFVY